MTEPTAVSRRQALLGAAAIGGLSGCLGRSDQHGESPLTEPPSPRPRETLFPLTTYESVDGRPVMTMPVNVRIDLRDSEKELSDVEEVFRSTLSWSRLARLADPFWPFHTSPTQFIWNGYTETFFPSASSYRRPFPLRVFVGEIGYHTYLWPIYDGDQLVGVAIQAHKDVGSVFDHRGTGFAEAAAAVGSIFTRRGWRGSWSAFQYDVSRQQFDQWGPTGDLVVYPPDRDGL